MERGQIYGASRLAGNAIGAGMASDQGQNCCAQAEGERRVEPTVRVTVEVRAIRNFADALMGAMDGQRVTRAGWNASGQYVAMQIPDKGSKMSSPYLYLKNAQNDLVPWVPSQGDLFANDWAILPRH